MKQPFLIYGEKSVFIMSVELIGCCGAYCGTCPPLKEGSCRGCKLGYKTGERDVSKARCLMKVCCLRKKLETCMDCQNYPKCKIIQGFQGKKGYKYKRYKQSAEFIREHGYKKFLEKAKDWKRAYGRLD